LHSYLKEKSPAIAAKYSKKKLREDFQQELRQKGYEDSFLNKENYLKAQQAFGPMFREPGKEVPRVSDKADSLFEISLPDFPRQHFSEDMLKRIGYLVYSNTSADWYEDDEKQLFMTYTHLDEQRQEIIGRLEDKGADTVALAAKLTEIATLQRVLQDHLAEKADEDLKTSLNAVYVTYKPEIEFVKTLFLNIDCIDAFIKSPDQGFYSFPYSYKPETEAKTHVKYENFNPDFFLKIKGSSNIVVVETKKAGDDSNKNRAKYRDGISHFDLLNRKLEETNKPERYYFKFVSDEGSDIADFFKSIRNRTYKEWCSSLMNQLSGN
jgi:type III restriction enzyme